jgi:hypothetical protein
MLILAPVGWSRRLVTAVESSVYYTKPKNMGNTESFRFPYVSYIKLFNLASRKYFREFGI